MMILYPAVCGEAAQTDPERQRQSATDLHSAATAARGRSDPRASAGQRAQRVSVQHSPKLTAATRPRPQPAPSHPATAPRDFPAQTYVPSFDTTLRKQQQASL